MRTREAEKQVRLGHKILTAAGMAGLAVSFLRTAPAAPPTPAPADPSGLAKVDRSIGKEPKYTGGKPLYGLFVFGPARKARIWAVLDKTSPDAPAYNVLYFDRNANGNLTEPDERIAAKAVGAGINQFTVGAFRDPASGATHADLSFTMYPDGLLGFMVKWEKKLFLSGGHDTRPTPGSQFSPTRQAAPVFWPGLEKPLRFGVIKGRDLTIGEGNAVYFVFGRPGLGRHTFTAIQFDLIPRGTRIPATLEYTDTAGKAKQLSVEVRRRCCTFEFYDSFVIPADARPGNATLRIAPPDDVVAGAVPAEIPVKLVPAS